MWKCPKCGRTFATKTQTHSCTTGTEEGHFENRPEALRKAYDKIVKAVDGFGPFHLEPMNRSIYFKKAGTFASVVVKKDHLKVEFFLDHLHDAFPVEKTFPYSGKKIVHIVPVASPAEVDAQLIGWLKESYGLTR